MKTTRPDYENVQALLDSLGDDEPIFIIRGQDLAAQAAIQAWINRAHGLGASDAICDRATATKRAIDIWQQKNVAKIPDVPTSTLTEEERAEVTRVKGYGQLKFWERIRNIFIPAAADRQTMYEQERAAWRKLHNTPAHSGRSTKLPNNR